MNDTLFIGIKPQFTKKILLGEKTIELRKSKPNIKIGGTVVIYATWPQKQVVGVAVVKDIIECYKLVFWNRYSNKTGVSSTLFTKYYEKRSKAIGIELERIEIFDNPINIAEIRKSVPSLKIFHGYEYMTQIELCNLRELG